MGTLRFLAFEELYLRPHGGLNNPMLIRSMVKVLRSSMAKALLSSTARAHHGSMGKAILSSMDKVLQILDNNT